MANLLSLSLFTGWYRVFELKTWCFELHVWLGFCFKGLLIKLCLVLSSGNLCLINHMKLYWPHTASAASDKNCQNSKLFLLIFDQIWIIFLLIQSLYELIYVETPACLINSTICATIMWRNDELNWLFTKRFRAFYLICRK